MRAPVFSDMVFTALLIAEAPAVRAEATELLSDKLIFMPCWSKKLWTVDTLTAPVLLAATKLSIASAAAAFVAVSRT